MARVVFIFVKQQTAYEMRISDWSSDVCSSDLGPAIVDAQHDRPPVLEVRHAYERRHLQGRMGGGQRILVVELTIRGQPRMKPRARSEEHTSELQSLMRISYAVFCLKQKNIYKTTTTTHTQHATHQHQTTNP